MRCSAASNSTLRGFPGCRKVPRSRKGRKWQETGGDSDSPVILLGISSGLHCILRAPPAEMCTNQLTVCPDRPRMQVAWVGSWVADWVGWCLGPEGPDRPCLCPVQNSPWADGMSLDGAVGNGTLCKLCGTLQVESCRPQRARTHLPTLFVQPVCKVLQWFPHGAPLFSRSRMDHLTPGKPSGYPQTAHPDLRKLKCA